MALKSTIFKAQLNVADMDRGVYGDFNLTLARHPSETEERMMLRLLAFALHADQALLFGRGISTDDEPDLWQKNLAGDIELWIDLGTPDAARMRRACGRSDKVVLYAYGGRGVDQWWQKQGRELGRLSQLSCYRIDADRSAALAAMAAPAMRLQCSIDGGEAWFSDNSTTIQVMPTPMAPP